MSRNILVTGGAGFIGSHTCKALYNHGYNPIAFDNLSTGNREFVKWGPLFEGDLLNMPDITKVFDEFQIEYVMHFAAKAYVHESMGNPLKYYRENIQGSMNLLEVFQRNKGKGFIFSSSCATYGVSGPEPITEDDVQIPINPYGFTKLAVEKLIIDLGRIHPFNYSILRYFNAVGGDMENEIGELHDPETHVIPLLVRASRTNEVFKIYGGDFETEDGTAIRDYVHVDDIALGHLNALERNIKSKKNLVCNLGSEIGTSVMELVSAMKEIDPNFRYAIEPRRAGDPERLVASSERSRKLLGLTYEKSDIFTVLSSVLRWQDHISNRQT
jgi:UDP-arabinose 4-epimerase